MAEDAGSRLSAYFAAQLRTEKARADLQTSFARLRVAEIEERAAEMASQHEPLASLIKSINDGNVHAPSFIREKILAIVRRVVYDRSDR